MPNSKVFRVNSKELHGAFPSSSISLKNEESIYSNWTPRPEREQCLNANTGKDTWNSHLELLSINSVNMTELFLSDNVLRTAIFSVKIYL